MGGMVLFWARIPCASMQPSMYKNRESSNNPLRVNRTECQYLNVQHNSRIYSDSRGIRMPNLDWTRGEAGDGG